MINCRGCGREIDTSAVDTGDKYLCTRCYYLQSAGQETGKPGSHKALLAVVYALLAAIAIAGLALTILYLAGVGNFAWFLFLIMVMVGVVVIPSLMLLKRRNLSLFLASLYLPLGIWVYLWYLAPGINWDRGKMTLWGAFAFLSVGLLATYLFIRDFRTLPRI